MDSFSVGTLSESGGSEHRRCREKSAITPEKSGELNKIITGCYFISERNEILGNTKRT